MLTITKVGSFEELMKLNNIWNALLEKSDIEPTFLNFEWISEWWKCFGKDKKMFILLVKENEETIGIAPLMISLVRKLGISIKKMEFIGMPLSDYCDFIIVNKKEEVINKIYEYLSENKNIWSFIKLSRILESSSTLSILTKVSKNQLLSNKSFCDILLYMDLNDEEFIRNNIINNKTKKRIRKIRREGTLSFLRLGDNEEKFSALIKKFFETHKLKWNMTNTPSMFNDPNYETFFSNVFKSLVQKGMADIFYLKFNDKLIALDLVFLYNKRILRYQQSYDIEYSNFSPGKTMMLMAVEYFISKGFKEINFMRGNEKYKLKFSKHATKLFSLSIHKNIILYFLDSFSSFIEKKIKENDKLCNFFIKYEKKLRIF